MSSHFYLIPDRRLRCPHRSDLHAHRWQYLGFAVLSTSWYYKFYSRNLKVKKKKLWRKEMSSLGRHKASVRKCLSSKIKFSISYLLQVFPNHCFFMLNVLWIIRPVQCLTKIIVYSFHDRQHPWKWDFSYRRNASLLVDNEPNLMTPWW